MTLLHHIWQRQGLAPDDVYKKPPNIRAFIFASTMVQIEAEEAERERIKNSIKK